MVLQFLTGGSTVVQFLTEGGTTVLQFLMEGGSTIACTSH